MALQFVLFFIEILTILQLTIVVFCTYIIIIITMHLTHYSEAHIAIDHTVTSLVGHIRKLWLNDALHT